MPIVLSVGPGAGLRPAESIGEFMDPNLGEKVALEGDSALGSK